MVLKPANFDGCAPPCTCTQSGGIGVLYSPLDCCEIVYGCTNPLAANYNPLATRDNGSCVGIGGLTWFDLKTLWKEQSPLALITTRPRGDTILPSIPVPGGGGHGGVTYSYTHKMCLHFGRLVGSAITQTFSRFAPITFPSGVVTNIVDAQVSGVQYYAVQFYGVRFPKILVTPPTKRTFTPSSTYFSIYPVTM